MLQLLELPEATRRDRIQQWSLELRAEGAPATIIQALEYLENADRARRALEILKKQS